MSRSDSRHVSCAKVMTRNKSAQPSVRTPAAPLCRSMMRPKVFQGTNSITCANSVLPTFMRHPGSIKSGSIANRRFAIQIVDTRELLETRVNAGFVVDSYQINRTLLILMLEEFLSDSAQRLTTHVEPRDAVAALRGGMMPDAILLDRMMPGIDGIAFMREFHKLPVLKHVPVIMQTAATPPQLIAEGLAECVFYYLAKPFKRDVLRAVLSNALASRAAYRHREEAISKADSALTRLSSYRSAFRDVADVDSISTL